MTGSREGLGHVGGDRPEALGDLARHHLEKRVAIGRGQGVGVLPVDLVLRIGVLVVRGVRLPAELVEVADDRAQVAHRAGEALEVVARLVHRVDAVGVEGGDAAVGEPRHEEVLGLGADHHRVTFPPERLERAPERRARAVGPRAGVDGDVTGEARDPGLPRHQGVGGEVGDRDHVVIVRPLAHP
jgi:hypothetical protein